MDRTSLLAFINLQREILLSASDLANETLEENPPSDQLLRLVESNSDAVLSRLFDIYHDLYWHLVTFRMDRRLMARIDADDVIQDAFLATQSRIHHWVRERKFSLFAWGRMMVIQCLIDSHRRHIDADMRCAGREVALGGPRMPNTTGDSLADGLMASQTSPSGKAIRNESHRSLMRMIGELSELDQEIIALRHFEGLSNSQAAEVLQLGITAASNRYVRAVARLQRLLTDGGVGTADDASTESKTST